MLALQGIDLLFSRFSPLIRDLCDLYDRCNLCFKLEFVKVGQNEDFLNGFAFAGDDGRGADAVEFDQALPLSIYLYKSHICS